MDERTLREEELTAVSGGAGEVSFARLAEDFVRANRCAVCPNRHLKRCYGMCTEEYNRLLLDWSKGGPVNTRCVRRPVKTAE